MHTNNGCGQARSGGSGHKIALRNQRGSAWIGAQWGTTSHKGALKLNGGLKVWEAMEGIAGGPERNWGLLQLAGGEARCTVGVRLPAGGRAASRAHRATHQGLGCGAPGRSEEAAGVHEHRVSSSHAGSRHEQLLGGLRPGRVGHLRREGRQRGGQRGPGGKARRLVRVSAASPG